MLTLALCERHGKPCLSVTPGDGVTPADVVRWVEETGVRVLNVAGNSERTSPGIGEWATVFLSEVFRLLVLSGAA